jgi:adenosylmethionine-8-amino-7-oxononanoate aminotransferase
MTSSSWKQAQMPSRLWPALLPLSEHNPGDLQIEAAQGHRIRFADGAAVLCATSGLWNVNLGYGNAAIAEAVNQALIESSYATLFRYWSSQAESAAAGLIQAAGEDDYARVIFSTSGSAANDVVMKLARQAQRLDRYPAKQIVVSLRGSYHGLTYGSFALTGEDLGQRLYGVDQCLIRHISFDTPEELNQLMALQGDRIAAVVIEPVLGTGAYTVSEEFLTELIRLREKHGFLIVADEVATGFGRTGSMFASSEWHQAPDVLITSKGLTNGTCAAAAILVSARIARLFIDAGETFAHGETQAGTPPTAAAIMATLDEFDRLDALSNAKDVAAGLDAGLERLAAAVPHVQAHRGRGCFRAVDVVDANGDWPGGEGIARLIRSIRDAGAIVHPGTRGFQLIPALTYTQADLTELFDALNVGVSSFAASGQGTGQ